MINETEIKKLFSTEDWWSVWVGFIVIAIVAGGMVSRLPEIYEWGVNPLEGLSLDNSILFLQLGLGLMLLLSLVYGAVKKNTREFIKAFPAVFIISVISFVIAGNTLASEFGLGYVIWALVLGIGIGNAFGVPEFMKPAVKGELYIKIGLVLLGAEILFNRLMILGIYGIGVAWIVTPVVLVLMYFIGTKVLGIASKALVVTISAATSVCGVSAAITAGGASKAKEEELCLALSITSIFTIFMMVLMPAIIGILGLDQWVGGAWIGGTIDATGAVVVAASILGDNAMETAATIKMIQNVLIGMIGFAIAFLWVTHVERRGKAGKANISQVWVRFPKFIIGFVLSSLAFSFIFLPAFGEAWVQQVHDITSGLRGWFFALAFVSIGLNVRLSEIGNLLKGGKPVTLYILGQTLNLILTLIAAYLMFGGVIFPPPA